MSLRISSIKILLSNLRDKGYRVSELGECLVIATSDKLVVVYKNNYKKHTWVVCKGDKREECELNRVMPTVRKYIKN